GLVEYFDESLLMLREQFGWGGVFYVRRNVTAGRIRSEALTGYDLAAVETINALDLELYDYARLLFREQAAAFPDLAAEAARFRALNGVVQAGYQVRGLYRPVAERLRLALRLGLVA